LGAPKSLFDKAKYANYPVDELKIDFYMKMVWTLTRRGNKMFNIFGGIKPLYVGVVSLGG
jgi:hypothetical protein